MPSPLNTESLVEDNFSSTSYVRPRKGKYREWDSGDEACTPEEDEVSLSGGHDEWNRVLGWASEVGTEPLRTVTSNHSSDTHSLCCRMKHLMHPIGQS